MREARCLLIIGYGFLLGCSSMADRLSPDGGKPASVESFKHGSPKAKTDRPRAPEPK